MPDPLWMDAGHKRQLFPMDGGGLTNCRMSMDSGQHVHVSQVSIQCNLWTNKELPIGFSLVKTFRNLDFLKTNVHAYFKGILFHYYQDFPYICIYCWKGNILENLYLLEKFFSEVT